MAANKTNEVSRRRESDADETGKTGHGTPKCRMQNCPTEVFDTGSLCQACSAECFGTERES